MVRTTLQKKPTKKLKSLFFKTLSTILLLSYTGCGGGGGTISILPTSDEFAQSDELNPKMDILWVVDNSGSMAQEINNVIVNINAFVNLYKDLDYNFRMGVISSAAWSIASYNQYAVYKAYTDCVAASGNCGAPPLQPEDNEDRSYLLHPVGQKDVFGRLHTGECVRENTGIPYITKNTPNLTSIFTNNFDVYGYKIGQNDCGTTAHRASNTSLHIPFIHQYYNGTPFTSAQRSKLATYIGDERPLQSMRAFLEFSPDATSFIRSDAFLAVILITDEEDHSRPSLKANNGPAGTHNVQTEYIDFLTALKGSPSLFKIYTITQLTSRPRLHSAANLSGGLVLEIIKSDDAEALNPPVAGKTKGSERYLDMLLQITSNVVESASVFPLNCEPMPSTIAIEMYPPPYNTKIVVPKAADSMDGEGWAYLPSNSLEEPGGSIAFSPDYFPKSGTKFFVNYTPIDLGCNPKGN